MLPLYGLAQSVKGFETDKPRHLLRVRDPRTQPSAPADTALVRSFDDVKAAETAGFQSVVEVGNALTSHPRSVVLPPQFDYLADGDIISVQPSTRRFRTLYRKNSSHNSFLVTERCNHWCLMCSQPPRDIDDRWILQEIRDALPLIDKQTHSLGFTGGETLSDWRDFFEVLSECRDTLSDTAIHVLSNGRAFANSEVAKAWATISHPKLTVGIPLYAAVDSIHDYVVQAKGAFDETVLGILKLKDKRQRVEVRIVLHAITAPHIVATCRWLARNLPFVDHVAIMGLENTGFAIANDELLWIDPLDYQNDLADAVEMLVAARVAVSVYNLPRCVLARSVWPYAAQSISDWKNDYLAECDDCLEKPRCGGFFTTGRPRYSRGILPITISSIAPDGFSGHANRGRSGIQKARQE